VRRRRYWAKRIRRAQLDVRRDLVHLAGCHLRRAASPCATALVGTDDWLAAAGRPVSVPRSLRGALGRQIGGGRG
jgi:hypothetical protein